VKKAAPRVAYADPERRLAGSGKSGKDLRLRAIDELPRASVRRWLRTTATRARAAK